MQPGRRRARPARDAGVGGAGDRARRRAALRGVAGRGEPAASAGRGRRQPARRTRPGPARPRPRAAAAAATTSSPRTSSRSPFRRWRTGSACVRRCGCGGCAAATSWRNCCGASRCRGPSGAHGDRGTQSTASRITLAPFAVARVAIATCVAVRAGRGGDRLHSGSSWRSRRRCSGVLCSIGWQRPAPRSMCTPNPGLHRCFEAEQARFDGVGGRGTRRPVDALDLTVSAWTACDSRRPETRLRHAAERRRHRRPLGPLSRSAAECTVDRARRAARRARRRSTPPTSSCSRWPRRSRPRCRAPNCSTDSAPTSPGTSAAASSTPTSARYVPGDQLRTVNWPVSARRGSLHVTERLSERAADVVVLVDTYPQPAGPATEATERTVRGAVQVVQSALRSGDRAGRRRARGPSPRWLGADIGRRQFYRVLDAVLGGRRRVRDHDRARWRRARRFRPARSSSRSPRCSTPTSRWR